MPCLFSTHQQTSRRLLNDNFTATEGIAVVRGAQHVDFGGFGVGSLNLDLAVESLHIQASAGLKLKAFSNLIPSVGLRIVARHAHGPTEALTNTAMCSPPTQDCCRPD